MVPCASGTKGVCGFFVPVKELHVGGGVKAGGHVYFLVAECGSVDLEVMLLWCGGWAHVVCDG